MWTQMQSYVSLWHLESLANTYTEILNVETSNSWIFSKTIQCIEDTFGANVRKFWNLQPFFKNSSNTGSYNIRTVSKSCFTYQFKRQATLRQVFKKVSGWNSSWSLRLFPIWVNVEVLASTRCTTGSNVSTAVCAFIGLQFDYGYAWTKDIRVTTHAYYIYMKKDKLVSHSAQLTHRLNGCVVSGVVLHGFGIRLNNWR